CPAFFVEIVPEYLYDEAGGLVALQWRHSQRRGCWRRGGCDRKGYSRCAGVCVWRSVRGVVSLHFVGEAADREAIDRAERAAGNGTAKHDKQSRLAGNGVASRHTRRAKRGAVVDKSVLGQKLTGISGQLFCLHR